MQTFSLVDFPHLIPVSLFETLKKHFGTPAIMLESAVTDESNRLSILACLPQQSIEAFDQTSERIRSALEQCHGFTDNPYFSGGLMGSVSFESVFDFSSKYSSQHEEKIPRTMLYEFGLVFVFDHHRSELCVLQHPKVNNFFAKKLFAEVAPLLDIDLSEYSAKSLPPDTAFLRSVEIAREAIFSGEIFQLVLSHDFTYDFPSHLETALYQALKQREPTTHLILANYGKWGSYTCASPEIIGKKVGNNISVIPIAGTRRRRENFRENLQIEKELLGDAKENAEHLMLVDLGRNDLSRVALPQSVHVTRQKYLQSYQHVMHLLSDIEAKINPQYDAVDFLASIFPAGTLSGAPKIRAIKLIQDLEKSSRGFYGGATGIIEKNDNLQMAINIRGVHLRDNKAHLRVGAGIVKDSTPENEWKELQNKSHTLRSILHSLLS